ncbi:MoaB/Mog domain-containing protein [Haematococcus lacustris]
MHAQMSLARLPRAACLLRGSHFRHGSALYSSAAVPAPVAPAAALLVVGDEILAGSITDVNTPWLAKLLHSRGVDLVRVEFVPDQADDIAATALRLRQRVGPSGFVFSSGGIGPTHDDVTYPALATAFGVQLALHQPTVELMKTSYGKRGMELNEARLRMATLPSPAEVLHTPGTWVPLVNLQGVYILPGIPSLFRQLITANQDRFSGPAIMEAALYSVPGESFIADQLSAVAVAHPKVSIGSYPNTDPATDQLWKVRIGVSSRSQQALDEALRALQSAVPDLLPQPPMKP